MSRLTRWFRLGIAAAVVGLILFGGAPWSIRPPEVSAFEPVPPGFKALYVFPGLSVNSNLVGASIHCTNVDRKKTADIIVEFYSHNGVFQGSASVTVPPGQTRTVSADQDGFTTLYSEDNRVQLAFLAQGSARVLVTGTTKLACTAQVLDSLNLPPSFVYTVPHFSPAGKH